MTGRIPSAGIPGVTVLSRLQASLSRLRGMLAPISVALLVAGALVAALGQVYLTLAYEPGLAAPNFGVISLAVGFVLFALGAFGRSADDDENDALSGARIASFPSGTGKFSPSRVLAVSVGGGLMAILVFRLLGGSESGWDMLLWLVAFCALAVPFIRRSNQSLESVTAIRERFVDVLIVAALVGIFVALNSHDLMDWYYSAIGDEYAHYNFAREFAEDGLKRPFDLDGVYSEINPVMASIYPALVMRLVGVDNFGWKFSLIVSVALTIPGVYLLGYIIAGRVAAFVSAATVALSHYIFAFMHTGYPNTDVLPIIVWSITLFVLGLRRGNPFLIYASGFLAGLGLLFNIVARAAIAIIILYALSHPDIRRRLLGLWPWALGVALTVVPLLLVNGSEVLSTALVKVVGPGSQHATEYEGILSRVIANAVQNLLAFNYNPHTSHYVSGALLDPISAVLCFAGAGVLPGDGTQGVVEAGVDSLCRHSRGHSPAVAVPLCTHHAHAQHGHPARADGGVGGRLSVQWKAFPAGWRESDAARHVRDCRSGGAGVGGSCAQRAAILVRNAKSLSPHPGGRCDRRNALGCV